MPRTQRCVCVYVCVCVFIPFLVLVTICVVSFHVHQLFVLFHGVPLHLVSNRSAGFVLIRFVKFNCVPFRSIHLFVCTCVFAISLSLSLVSFWLSSLSLCWPQSLWHPPPSPPHFAPACTMYQTWNLDLNLYLTNYLHVMGTEP